MRRPSADGSAHRSHSARTTGTFEPAGLAADPIQPTRRQAHEAFFGRFDQLKRPCSPVAGHEHEKQAYRLVGVEPTTRRHKVNSSSRPYSWPCAVADWSVASVTLSPKRGETTRRHCAHIEEDVQSLRVYTYCHHRKRHVNIMFCEMCPTCVPQTRGTGPHRIASHRSSHRLHARPILAGGGSHFRTVRSSTGDRRWAIVDGRQLTDEVEEEEGKGTGQTTAPIGVQSLSVHSSQACVEVDGTASPGRTEGFEGWARERLRLSGRRYGTGLEGEFMFSSSVEERLLVMTMLRPES
ncbi:unnamed protein product [Protopolystoma xenopodis]|uniref:Uncharacterized protein n=1 Tax=Protopolystoma xenopodis TaxID=117903 RepID=A0A448WKJ0_9PLAT|nr:unnamed protein product [Protopolystoma xenopodis]